MIVMENVRFVSGFEDVGGIPEFGPTQVKNEPMLFSADRAHAMKQGGPITGAFLDALPEDWRASELVIDSRVHMLMPGWWPCIPGWHLDDVPRNSADGQPNHITPAYRSEHILMLVGDCCPTEFLSGEIALPNYRSDELGTSVCPETNIYGAWHGIIDEMLGDPHSGVSSTLIEDRRLIRFGWGAFHRGTPARSQGWRFFIRASRGTQRAVLNETRAQVQVYLPIPSEGWK